jgi:hypothetical protein
MSTARIAYCLDYIKHKIILTGLIFLLIVVTFVTVGGIYSCDDSNSQNNVPVAILSATESQFVPGRIELDGSRSFVTGRVKMFIPQLSSHTYTVRDQETGEIVYGPEVLTEALDQALIKIYLPAGDYLATLTVEYDPNLTPEMDVSADVRAEESSTDTTEMMFSLDAEISSSSTDCDATCSANVTDQVACILTTDCTSADLLTDVMDVAATLNSDIDEDTTMWIQAFGGSGGNGVACWESGGDGGDGGFAQMITTVSDFSDTYGSTTIYYYIGSGGTHDSDCPNTSGTGGTSSILATIEPSSDNYFALEDIVVLAGGGGGAGTGGTVSGRTGGDGGDGASAVSTTSSVSSAAGDDASHGDSNNGKGGNSDGDGNGGDSGGKDESGDGKSGIGGEGGNVGSGDEECIGGPGWETDAPTLDDDAGEGGYGGADSDTCFGGAGGGGYGGGGGGSAADDARDLGGGGGGSYAAISTTSDGDAPSSGSSSGDGEIVITFNTSPLN